MFFERSTKKQSFFFRSASAMRSIRAGTAMMMFLALFLAACASHLSEDETGHLHKETVMVSVFAGGEEGFADGEGSAAWFKRPSGIAIDTAGNLYVADSLNNRIRKITPKGEVSTLAGGERGFVDGKGSAARFDWPNSIVIDAVGNLYVADSLNNRIRMVTIEGEVSTLAGGERGLADGKGSTARFDTPLGIAMDAMGNLYVADTANDHIRKVTPEGDVSTFAGDKEGFFDRQGATAQLDGPTGIAFDAAGNLYVVDTNNERIRKVTPEGEIGTLAGGEQGFADGQGRSAQFFGPLGITIDVAGNLYVADALNNRIRKVTPKGEVSTLAGSGATGLGKGDFADGEGNIAQFNEPHGIAIDAAGNFYVADTENNRIRKIAIQRH